MLHAILRAGAHRRLILPLWKCKPVGARCICTAAVGNTTTDACKRLRIFYGSQTGTAQAFANELSLEAVARGLEQELIDLSTFNSSMLEDPTVLNVFLLAVYGRGEPTDNARRFHEWIMSKSTKISGATPMQFAVFGLGNKQTHAENFCVVGRQVDFRLAELGACRFLPRVDGDDSECIEEQFDEWQQQLLTKLSAGCDVEKAPNSSVATDVQPADHGLAMFFADVHVPSKRPLEEIFECLNTGFYRTGTLLCPVTANKELTPASNRSTAEIHIDTGTYQTSYQTGDHAVIYATNNFEIVEAYLDLLQVNNAPGNWFDRMFYLGPDQRQPICLWPDAPPMTFREILSHCTELMHAPGVNMIRFLRRLCPDPTSVDAQKLDFYVANYGQSVVGQCRTLLDLLNECSSVRLYPNQLLAMLPRLKPRFYSISSSSTLSPNNVHLTYRVMQLGSESVCGTRRLGMCSSWLRGLQPSSDRVPMQLVTSDFRLPADVSTPVLMIAGGTGIAPYKAFLEERMALGPGGTTGPMELYYGIRDDTEYAYRELLTEAQAHGCLSALAVSRNPRRCDDLLREHGQRIWSRVEEGAHLYICGGAHGFGPAVVTSLTDIFASLGHMSHDAAGQLLAELIATGRYCEDLSD